MRALKWLGYLLAAVLLILVLALVFIDVIAHHLIESEATKAVKAEVELDAVDISFFPLAAELHGLKVTNPQAPMTNAFEADTVDATLSWAPLLQTKVIVEEANLLGMRFNEPREKSGAVPGLTPPPSEGPSLAERVRQDLKLPAVTLPDPEELLRQADLQSVKLANQLQADIQQKKNAWDARIKALPGEEQVAAYKAELKSLKEAKGVAKLQAAAKLPGIIKEIRSELSQVKSLRDELQSDLEQLKQRSQQIKAAPKQDLEAVLSKVGLNAESIQGLARALLGDAVGNWLQNAYRWYETLQPYLNGGGKPAEAEVAQPDTRDYSDGLPRFLVKTLNLDGEIPVPGRAIAFEGKMENLTDQAQIWGRPAEIFLGGGQAGSGLIALNGVLDHVNPEAVKDSFGLDLEDFPLEGIILSNSPEFPVTLARALARIASKAVIQNGQLDLDVDARFMEVELSDLLAGESSPVKQALLSTLQTLDTFQLEVAAEGKLQDPEVRFSSSLDDILKKALGGVIESKRKEISGQLREQIQKRVGPELARLDEQMAGFSDLRTLLVSRADGLNGLL